MTRFADAERCPDCLSPMPLGSPRCPTCGLSLEGPAAAQLFSTLTLADQLLASMRAASVGASERTVETPAQRAAPAASGDAGIGPVPSDGPRVADGAVATLAPPRATGVGGPGAPGRPPSGGLSGTSVPRILLGLGALCLLIAALVFLAVNWSALGVAGRTAALVGFTAVAAGLAAWAAARDLRAAAESLGIVALGLLSFDMFGARDAGWLGDITTAEFLAVLGSVLACAGAGAALAVRRTPVGALVGAEVVAALGVATAVTGMVGADWLPWSPAMTVAVVLAAAVAVAASATRLVTIAVGASMVALAAWILLALSAWDRAVAHPSLGELWLELEGWPLLAAAALAASPLLLRRLPQVVHLAALSVTVLVLAGGVLAPFADETITESTTAAAVLLTVLSLLAWLVSQPWRRSGAVALAPGLAWMTMALLTLAGSASGRMADAGSALWAGSAGDRFPVRAALEWVPAPWLLPVTVVAASVALVALARSYTFADRAVAPLADADLLMGVGLVTTIATLASYALPIWLVLDVVLAGAVLFVARSLARDHPLPLILGVLFLAAALVIGLHAEWLTLLTLVVGLVASAALYLRSPRFEVSVAAGALVASALAGLVWTVGALADARWEWTAVAVLLALATLVLAGPYVDEPLRVSGPPGHARLGTEIGAFAAGAVAAAAATGVAPAASAASWAAVYLTLAGASASAVALLRTDRRPAGWIGGFLLAAASWVRLADLGVDTPEAYTLPSAIALLVVGLAHLRRYPDAGTTPALSAGLALGLVPSLLWVVAEPIAVRSLVLGLACLALVLGGARLRWSAPVVYGAVVGSLLVLRHATPIAEAVPRWALIGTAGALLVAAGITWEKRVRDARAVAGYVRGLR